MTRPAYPTVFAFQPTSRAKRRLRLLTVFVLTAVCVSAQDWAKARLEKSPRHGEWITVMNGARAVQCWVVYPEVKEKATAVLILHDSSGMTDWARLSADEIAAAGYLAIAPDFLSGKGPNGGGTSAFSGQSELVLELKKLPPDQITGDLNAAAEYVKALPAANGKLAVAGFCWGGSEASRSACNRTDLKAVFVFYGYPPREPGIKNIPCPVYGFYGENDARVTLTVPPGQVEMKNAGKEFEPVIYAGAGHGFMAHGEPDYPSAKPDDRKAHDKAWERLKALLKKI
jgi:carboxymethylenebutenolidase